jgi:hypothetical protein
MDTNNLMSPSVSMQTVVSFTPSPPKMVITKSDIIKPVCPADSVMANTFCVSNIQPKCLDPGTLVNGICVKVPESDGSCIDGTTLTKITRKGKTANVCDLNIEPICADGFNYDKTKNQCQVTPPCPEEMPYYLSNISSCTNIPTKPGQI